MMCAFCKGKEIREVLENITNKARAIQAEVLVEDFVNCDVIERVRQSRRIVKYIWGEYNGNIFYNGSGNLKNKVKNIL